MMIRLAAIRLLAKVLFFRQDWAVEPELDFVRTGFLVDWLFAGAWGELVYPPHLRHK